MRQPQRRGGAVVRAALIAAARAERMPVSSRRRALGVAAGVGAAKLTSASAAPPALLGSAVWKGAAVVAGAAVLAGTVYGVATRGVRAPTPPAPQPTHSIEEAPRPTEPAFAAIPAPTPRTEV